MINNKQRTKLYKEVNLTFLFSFEKADLLITSLKTKCCPLRE